MNEYTAGELMIFWYLLIVQDRWQDLGLVVIKKAVYIIVYSIFTGKSYVVFVVFYALLFFIFLKIYSTYIYVQYCFNNLMSDKVLDTKHRSSRTTPTIDHFRQLSFRRKGFFLGCGPPLFVVTRCSDEFASLYTYLYLYIIIIPVFIRINYNVYILIPLCFNYDLGGI